MSVYKKLMTVRVLFNQLELKKSGHNKFAGYSYFELGDFLPQAQKLFYENGLAGVISYGKDQAALTITDVEDNSQIVITSPMAEAALKGCHPIQNLGAVETYTRRYLWVTALELVEHDAIDSSEPVKPEKVTAKAHKPTDGAFEMLTAEEQQIVLDYADKIIHAENVPEAFAIYRSAYVNDDGTEDGKIHVALWSKLPSDIRSAIKKHGQQQKEQK